MPMEATEHEETAAAFVEPWEVRTGTCEGGPLDGREIAIRCPLGFLAADTEAGKGWVYAPADPDRWVLVPEADGTLDRELDDEKALRTALGDRYDVVAIPCPGEDDDGDQD